MDSWSKSEIGMVSDLVEQFGSDAEARRFLAGLGVPVHGGAFSRPLMVERLKQEAAHLRSEGIETPRWVSILQTGLAPAGISIRDYRVGRPTLVQLMSDAGECAVGFPGDDDDPEFAPVMVGSSEATSARTYTAATRVGSKAGFSLSGFFEEKAAPLYFCVLVDEERVWCLTAGELRYIYGHVANKAAHKEVDELTRQFVRVKGREGVLRAAFGRAPCDWELAVRLVQ